jgi:hypothetical protein
MLNANVPFIKKEKKAGSQWLMPIILAIQEAEIRTANSSRDPIMKKPIMKGWWGGSRCRP